MAPSSRHSCQEKGCEERVMSTKRVMIASIAILALFLSGYTTLAEPGAGPDAVTPAQSVAAGPGSSLALVKGPGGGGFSHGYSGGARSFSPGFSRGVRSFSPVPGGIRSFNRVPTGRSFNRVPTGRSFMLNRRPTGGAILRDYGRRGVRAHHFRHRRFVNGAWVWVWDDWGGSCYSNCLEAGYSPRYCSVYSYNFC